MLSELGKRVRRLRRDRNCLFALKWLPSQGTILDVGCGRGEFLRFVGDRGIGLDWNEESLAEAAKFCGKVIHGDVRVIPLDTASVDGANCSHVIEHFVPADVHKILSEIDRVLKPGAVLVLSSPTLWAGFYNDLTHVRPYNPGAILHYLQRDRAQRTLGSIDGSYVVLRLKSRYAAICSRFKVLGLPFAILNLWGFPWLRKTGYTLVLRKEDCSVGKA